MTSLVDVVIVSYNSRKELRAAVEPLAADPRLSVVVVDNASADASLEAVADLPVATIQLERNVGFGGGCNAGWRTGTAPHVLFLNPDASIDGDAVVRLAAALDDAGGGIIAPRINRPDGSLDWSLRRFPSVRSILGQAAFAHRLLPGASWVDEVIRDPRAYDDVHSCDWVSGACLLARRDVLSALNGFDDATFFMYCEDVDLCRRAHGLGYDVVFTPDVVCTHVGGASAPRAELFSTLARSRIAYARKHFSPLRATAYRFGVALNALTHVLAARTRRSRAGYARALAAALAS